MDAISQLDIDRQRELRLQKELIQAFDRLGYIAKQQRSVKSKEVKSSEELVEAER